MDMAMHPPEARVVANDLEIYFKGFEVSLKRNNTEDSVRYLESMIEEIDYTIDHLQPIKELKIAREDRKSRLKRAILDHRRVMKDLEDELKAL
jgi:hypothetical protein